MIIDSRNEFCSKTALNTGAAGTYLVGNVIDLGDAYGLSGQNVNDVDCLYLVISVDTAVTSAGAATVQFALATDNAAAIATDGSATIHWQSAAIPKASLAAGYYVAKVELPKGSPPYERYLGVLQTTGVAALTAGKVNAFLTSSVSTWLAHNDKV